MKPDQHGDHRCHCGKYGTRGMLGRDGWRCEEHEKEPAKVEETTPKPKPKTDLFEAA